MKTRKYTYIIIFSIILLFFGTIWFAVEAKGQSIKLFQLIPLSNDSVSFEEQQTLSFTDLDSIVFSIDDVRLSILESDVDEVTITSTVENTGTGYITQPKAWVDNNTLYFDQGVALGYGTKATGEIVLEVPKSLELDYDISNGSGDVLFEVNTANDIVFDMAVGELNVYTSCENFTANSVSGDINIYGAMNNITVDTVSSDVSLFANATTSEISFESVSGDCKVFADELGGYHLYHKYAGGNIDDYFELSNNHDSAINIIADTVDGKIEVFDKSILDDASDFFKEDK